MLAYVPTHAHLFDSGQHDQSNIFRTSTANEEKTTTATTRQNDEFGANVLIKYCISAIKSQFWCRAKMKQLRQ